MLSKLAQFTQPFTLSGRYYINNTWGDWWNTDTVDNFLDVEKCFIDYYHQQVAGPYLIEGRNRTVSNLFEYIIRFDCFSN